MLAGGEVPSVRDQREHPLHAISRPRKTPIWKLEAIPEMPVGILPPSASKFPAVMHNPGWP
jgi:hypothetical protein